MRGYVLSDKSAVLFEAAMENVQESIGKLESKIGDLSYYLYMLEGLSSEDKAKIDDLITDVYVIMDGLK